MVVYWQSDSVDDDRRAVSRGSERMSHHRRTREDETDEIVFEGRAFIRDLGEIMNEGELQERSEKKGVGDDYEPIERREIGDGSCVIAYVEAERCETEKRHYADVHPIGCSFAMDEKRHP